MRVLTAQTLHLILFCEVLICVSPASECLAVTWNESSDGDLSNDRLAPTSIALSAGTNSVAGSMTSTDKEYFTVVIPDNYEFRPTPTVYEGDDFVAFIGVQAGTQMTVPPNTSSAAGLLGWLHFADFNLNQNILPGMGNGFGAMGFTPPLPSGTYTFWVQQLDGLLVTYQFNFGVTAVATLPGDYNQNGVVDAADYVVWRNGDSPDSTQAGYDTWRAHFGQTAGNGSSAIANAVVPEPAISTMLILVATIWRLRRNRIR